MRRLPVLLLIGTLFLALWVSPLPSTLAANGITVVESKSSHMFAQQATFTLQATSKAKIAQVYLFFRATGDEQAESVNVTFEPAREINITYLHDLRLSPLPPFSTFNASAASTALRKRP